MRRARRRRAARRWASRSRPTRPATCSRACAAAASARSCCARTWTPCRSHAPIDPVLVDDGWENANDGILGADNKAAVAMILEIARRCSVEGSPVGLELLFTVAEEVGLQGAKRFDVGQLQLRVRLRVRPRDADRRDRHRLADAVPHRGRVPRQVRPRRPAPGVRPLGDPRRRPRRRRDAARPDRRRRRPPTSATCTAASSRPTSSPSARACSPRSAPWTRTRPRRRSPA